MYYFFLLRVIRTESTQLQNNSFKNHSCRIITNHLQCCKKLSSTKPGPRGSMTFNGTVPKGIDVLLTSLLYPASRVSIICTN